jgi:hypothetical protein
METVGRGLFRFRIFGNRFCFCLDLNFSKTSKMITGIRKLPFVILKSVIKEDRDNLNGCGLYYSLHVINTS